MYISKIKISNYRGIKSQELDFQRFNALVGKNDCGKSTVINAIKLFFDDAKASTKDFNYYQNNRPIEIEIILSDYEKNSLKPFLVKGDKDDGFDNVADDYLFDDSLTIKKIWEYKEGKDVGSRTYIKVNTFQESFIHEDKKLVTKGIKDNSVEIPTSGSGNNSDLEKLHYLREEFINQDKVREIKWQTVKKWSEIVDSLPTVELFKADQSIETTTTDFKSTFSSEIKHIIQREKEKEEENTLSAIEEIITNKIAEESIAIQHCMSEHISGLEELAIKPNFSWERGVEITNVDIKLEGDERPIPLENKGSGYRRLFMVGRLRYLANKNHLNNVIYLVEEPETFLHPSAQDEMRDSLLSLSESNQVLITTHSPIFLGATNENAITLCKKENTELKYEQRVDDEFLIDIARQIGVKPSHNVLDTYKTIVFVEGSNDIKFLRIASEKLDCSFHELIESNKIVVFFGGGKSLENFIDIEYFEKLKKKMFLIIDSDKGMPSKVVENETLKDKIDAKENGEGYILNKRNIENYYYPDAIRRKYGIEFEHDEHFAEDENVASFMKQLNSSNPGKNIKKKNDISIYEEMTKQEWKAVSDGELEAVFVQIEACTVNEEVGV